MTKSKYISKKEVANLLGSSETTISRWAKLGVIPMPFALGPNKIVWDIDEINLSTELKKQKRGFLGHKPDKTQKCQ
jgi:predicted DNA-binding transcriptional regulator AlpA